MKLVKQEHTQQSEDVTGVLQTAFKIRTVGAALQHAQVILKQN